MIKDTRNSLKFNKMLEYIFELKLKLLNTKYYEDISNIDQRAKLLFETYNKGNTVKQEVTKQLKSQRKQNGFLKYKAFIENEEGA
mgnify:FL=1